MLHFRFFKHPLAPKLWFRHQNTGLKRVSRRVFASPKKSLFCSLEGNLSIWEKNVWVQNERAWKMLHFLFFNQPSSSITVVFIPKYRPERVLRMAFAGPKKPILCFGSKSINLRKKCLVTKWKSLKNASFSFFLTSPLAPKLWFWQQNIGLKRVSRMPFASEYALFGTWE